MTVFEHAMLGASLGLAADMQKRYGWRVIGMAALAGALPDWDGLSILFGPEAYARAHRVWGHNLLVTAMGGLLIAWLEYRFCLFSRCVQSIARRLPGLVLPAVALVKPERGKSLKDLGCWLALGLTAGYSHLLADYFYSGHPGLHTWGLPLLWPFSNRVWAGPTVAWGDLGATLIFVAEMFALYRWPVRARLIAWLALAAVAAYVAAHGLPVHSGAGLKAGLSTYVRINGRATHRRAGVPERLPVSQASRKSPERFLNERARPVGRGTVPDGLSASRFGAAGGKQSDRAERGRAKHLDGAWVFSFAGIDVCGWPACEDRLILRQGRRGNQRADLSDSREIFGRVVKKGMLRVFGKANQFDRTLPARPLFTRSVPGTNSSIVACRQNI